MYWHQWSAMWHFALYHYCLQLRAQLPTTLQAEVRYSLLTRLHGAIDKFG
ncbi:alkaline phosphatase [Acetobacter orientalis]|uniref:Alkaline phosphatase n=1 Tax=Acetobacter orientalis TaxID=146474 RepID=A0A2Z5ZE73_9PROT|nr:alkaline phosphatase [Acetobacter orientalis]